jgi:hypothetical protein
MKHDNFVALVVPIWRLKMRLLFHTASGNRRAARHVQSRIDNLCRKLAAL